MTSLFGSINLVLIQAAWESRWLTLPREDLTWLARLSHGKESQPILIK